eukprot:tig00021582_g22624.t1
MSCFAALATPLRPPAQAANGWRGLPSSLLSTAMPTPRARTAGRTPAPAAVDVTCSSRQPPRAAFEASDPLAKPASRRALLSALALAAAAAAARPDAARAANKVDWDAAEFTATKSGLLVKDDVEGEGPSPRRNMIVTIHYKGMLGDGYVFDEDRERPFDFVIGQGRAIKGWEEGIGTMKVGGRRRIIVPPELGWGDKGNGLLNVPPNATTYFEVELLKARKFF